jgi:hypothetical protein
MGSGQTPLIPRPSPPRCPIQGARLDDQHQEGKAGLPLVTISEHDSRVQLRIIDHGPGIPEDQRDHVTLPFQRLGDRSNGTGVGLGLALSRGLIEAMGGTLVPETTPGGGLTMVLMLPATEPADTGAAAAADIAERAILQRLHRRPPTGPDAAVPDRVMRSRVGRATGTGCDQVWFAKASTLLVRPATISTSPA